MHSLLSVFRRVARRQRERWREHPVIFIACVWQIETINDQLKNVSQIEHTRHRSVAGFMVHLLCDLIASSFQPKKPSLGLRDDSRRPVLVM
jgi:Transposase DDE domain